MGILERLLKWTSIICMNFLVRRSTTNQKDLQSISIFKNIYLSTLNDLNPVEQQEGPWYEEYLRKPSPRLQLLFILACISDVKGGKNTRLDA